MKKARVEFMRKPGESIMVGELSENRGRSFFAYDPDFLESGLNLSPFLLPYEEILFEHRDHEFGPLPGLFDDSLPDGWGLLLMDRYFHTQGVPAASITPLDRLLWLGTRTMGALTYHPQLSESGSSSFIDLQGLYQASQEILKGSARTVLPELIRNGGSPGGDRPKVLICYNQNHDQMVSGVDDAPDGFDHWIVKFHADRDEAYDGVIEYAYAHMAKEAGLVIPETRLFDTEDGNRFFGIKRFDRAGNRRYHIHSFGNMIQSNFRIPSADYRDYLRVTSLLIKDHTAVLQAFRQMVFNICIHNRDDHVKNFSYLLDDRSNRWQLAPSYDLTYSSGVAGEHTMTVAGEGKQPKRKDLERLATEFSISSHEMTLIIDQVIDAARSWKTHAMNLDIPSEKVQAISEQIRICCDAIWE